MRRAYIGNAVPPSNKPPCRMIPGGMPTISAEFTFAAVAKRDVRY
jgi:hypothetical protein